MIKKLDHIIMVVKDLEAAVKTYETILHLTPEGGAIKDIPGLRLAMLPTPDGSRIELIEPKPGSTKRHAEFLKKHGEGVFGLSAFIENFDEEIAALRKSGITVEEETQASVHAGYTLKLGWIRPEQGNGVWIELVDAESLPPRLR
jgi:catechol 2,3-dioxygenase-like lactoylglutathione lyase family enzyme